MQHNTLCIIHWQLMCNQCGETQAGVSSPATQRHANSGTDASVLITAQWEL